MNFLDTGKEIGFCGQPKSKNGLPNNLTPARLSALAWARSNFPAEGGPEILEAKREGTEITVILIDQEIVRFNFETKMDAARALRQLPKAQGLQCHFQIAADEQAALQAEMNWGQVEQPAAHKAYEFTPA